MVAGVCVGVCESFSFYRACARSGNFRLRVARLRIYLQAARINPNEISEK